MKSDISDKLYLALLFFLVPEYLSAMHIMEGFLPIEWAVFWWALVLPFLYFGFVRIKRLMKNKPELKMLIVLASAFAFVLSALKLPSVTGSSSHPTGVALGTLMFGPVAMSILGLIVLLFQALLLAHGGLTTLGANIFSMAVAGPLVTYFLYRACIRINIKRSIAVVFSAFTGNLFTYIATSLQLALAYPDVQNGVFGSFIKFAGIFAVTQVPIALSEGILTLLVLNILMKYAVNEMNSLEVLRSING